MAHRASNYRLLATDTTTLASPRAVTADNLRDDKNDKNQMEDPNLWIQLGEMGPTQCRMDYRMCPTFGTYLSTLVFGKQPSEVHVSCMRRGHACHRVMLHAAPSKSTGQGHRNCFCSILMLGC